MSGAIYRVRKRIQALEWLADVDGLVDIKYAMSEIVAIIDEEIEKDAEKEFTKSIKPVEFTGE